MVAGHAVRARKPDGRRCEAARLIRAVALGRRPAVHVVVSQRTLQRHPAARPLILQEYRMHNRSIGVLEVLRDRVVHAGRAQARATLNHARCGRRRGGVERVAHQAGIGVVHPVVLHLRAGVSQLRAVAAGHIGPRRAPVPRHGVVHAPPVRGAIRAVGTAVNVGGFLDADESHRRIGRHMARADDAVPEARDGRIQQVTAGDRRRPGRLRQADRSVLVARTCLRERSSPHRTARQSSRRRARGTRRQFVVSVDPRQRYCG